MPAASRIRPAIAAAMIRGVRHAPKRCAPAATPDVRAVPGLVQRPVPARPRPAARPVRHCDRNPRWPHRRRPRGKRSPTANPAATAARYGCTSVAKPCPCASARAFPAERCVVASAHARSGRCPPRRGGPRRLPSSAVRSSGSGVSRQRLFAAVSNPADRVGLPCPVHRQSRPVWSPGATGRRTA